FTVECARQVVPRVGPSVCPSRLLCRGAPRNDRLLLSLRAKRRNLDLTQSRETAMAETRIGVIGCAGRMGRMLVADIPGAEGCAVAGGVARPGAACLGQDIGELAGIPRVGIAVGDNAEQLLHDSDVVVDFTMPTATADHAKLAASLGKAVVIGTTGLSGAEEKAVRDAAEKVPIVWAANTSLGINLLLGLVQQVAQRLRPDWDLGIFRVHHN